MLSIGLSRFVSFYYDMKGGLKYNFKQRRCAHESDKYMLDANYEKSKIKEDESFLTSGSQNSFYLHTVGIFFSSFRFA